MPLQEFWNEDPDLLWVYRTSYLQKIKEQKDTMNFHAWLQGIYIREAIVSALNKNAKYMTKPLNLNGEEEKTSKTDIAKRIKERMNRGKALLQQRSEKKE